MIVTLRTTNCVNGKGQPGCSEGFRAGAQKGCISLPSRVAGLGPGAGRDTAHRGVMGDGSIASSTGDDTSRLKFSACPWYCAEPRHEQSVSLLFCSLPDSNIQVREQTERARSPHLPNSQRRPKNPDGHWQVVTFPSRQLPPLRHSQPSESSARQETGASQDSSCLQGWDSQADLLDATPRGSSGGRQPQAPLDTQAQSPSAGVRSHCSIPEI